MSTIRCIFNLLKYVLPIDRYCYDTLDSGYALYGTQIIIVGTCFVYGRSTHPTTHRTPCTPCRGH